MAVSVNICSLNHFHLAVSLQVNISMNCSHSLAVSSEVNTSSMKCSYSLAVSSQVNISSMNCSHLLLLLLAVSWQVNIGSMKCSHLLAVCSQVNISSMKCSHSLSVSSQVNIGSMNCSHLLSVSSQVSVGVFHYCRKVHNFYLPFFHRVTPPSSGGQRSSACSKEGHYGDHLLSTHIRRGCLMNWWAKRWSLTKTFLSLAARRDRLLTGTSDGG